MSLYESILGTIQTLFHIGGPSGPAWKRSTNDIQARNTGDTVMANVQVAAATADAHATTYLDLKRRCYLIEWNFDGGGVVPPPGTNTGKYGFCHTSGGGYTAGQVYYDDGAAIVVATVYKMGQLMATTAVTGTVSLIANGVYIAQTAAAPFTWTLKGDGTLVYTGLLQSIRIPLLLVPATSTTVIPTSSKVMRVYTNVTTPYSGGTTIEVAIGAEVLQATTENDPTVAAAYKNDPLHDVVSGDVVTVTIAGAPGAGAGEVIVEYDTSFFA